MSDNSVKPGEETFPQPVQLDAAARAAQKKRNLWLGLALLGFVLLVALTTYVRLGASEKGQADFYYNMNQSGQEAPPAPPPGMTPEQTAPPPNLTAEPSHPEESQPEEEGTQP
ncbi:MAG: hypothetical protein R3B98_09700 [Hyphomonas sp.]